MAILSRDLNPSARDFVIQYVRIQERQHDNFTHSKKVEEHFREYPSSTNKYKPEPGKEHPIFARAKADIESRVSSPIYNIDERQALEIYDTITQTDDSYFHKISHADFLEINVDRYREIKSSYHFVTKTVWAFIGITSFVFGTVFGIFLSMSTTPFIITASVIAAATSLVALSIIAFIAHGKQENRKTNTNDQNRYDNLIAKLEKENKLERVKIEKKAESEQDAKLVAGEIGSDKPETEYRLSNVNIFQDIDYGVIRGMHKQTAKTWGIAALVNTVVLAAFAALLSFSFLPITALTAVCSIGLGSITAVSALATIGHLYFSKHAVYPRPKSPVSTI